MSTILIHKFRVKHEVVKNQAKIHDGQVDKQNPLVETKFAISQDRHGDEYNHYDEYDAVKCAEDICRWSQTFDELV